MEYFKRRLYYIVSGGFTFCEHCKFNFNYQLYGRLYSNDVDYYTSHLIGPNTVTHNAIIPHVQAKVQTFTNRKELYHVRMCGCCKSLKSCVKVALVGAQASVISVIRRI